MIARVYRKTLIIRANIYTQTFVNRVADVGITGNVAPHVAAGITGSAGTSFGFLGKRGKQYARSRYLETDSP